MAGIGAVFWSAGGGCGDASSDGCVCAWIGAAAGRGAISKPVGAGVGHGGTGFDCSGDGGGVEPGNAARERDLPECDTDTGLLVFEQVALVRMGGLDCTIDDSFGGCHGTATRGG